VSETTYHVEWDAPYDPYGFWGTPVGYVIFSDNFEHGRGEQYRAIAKIDGSEEWGNGWRMDVSMEQDVGTAVCTPAPELDAFGDDEWEQDWGEECWPEKPTFEATA
jgi:hypothetical protein